MDCEKLYFLFIYFFKSVVSCFNRGTLIYLKALTWKLDLMPAGIHLDCTRAWKCFWIMQQSEWNDWWVLYNFHESCGLQITKQDRPLNITLVKQWKVINISVWNEMWECCRFFLCPRYVRVKFSCFVCPKTFHYCTIH